MQHSAALTVVSQGAVVVQLLAGKEEALLLGRDGLLGLRAERERERDVVWEPTKWRSREAAGCITCSQEAGQEHLVQYAITNAGCRQGIWPAPRTWILAFTPAMVSLDSTSSVKALQLSGWTETTLKARLPDAWARGAGCTSCSTREQCAWCLIIRQIIGAT